MNADRFREFRSRGFLIALVLTILILFCLFQVGRYERAARPLRELGGKVYGSGNGTSQIFGPAGVTFVDLSGTAVGDAQLEHLGEQLEGLSGLRVLNLSRTPITDAGLEYLKGLTQLKSLDLSETNITEEGATRLSKALPTVLILTRAKPGVPGGKP